ncbi:MAG TPA: hypothetical protein VLU46_16045, partial [Thermoanaerobaculia bacterium]|nr:hypothetical protein [Thermoanaerobaculia bacterium]
MKELFVVATLFVAAALYAATPVGRLFVHMPAGFEVFVDGTSYGPTTTQEGGKILQLAPGAHRVVVRSAEGREGSFNVTLGAGESRDVTLSPLGLRKKLATAANDDATGALRVNCIPEDCTVTFKPPVDAVPAGRYPLAVSRGNGVLKTDVDVPATMIVTVEANFNSGTIRTVDTRKRPQKLAVSEANDALTRLAVPPHWKTAIRGALPSGVSIEGATGYTNGVR